MPSAALSILFLLVLSLGLAVAWLWISLRSSQKKIEEKVAESLDDQDLAAFQESVSGLIADLKQSSDEAVNRMETALRRVDQATENASEASRRLEARTRELEARAELVSRTGPSADSANTVRRKKDGSKKKDSAGEKAQRDRLVRTLLGAAPAKTKVQAKRRNVSRPEKAGTPAAGSGSARPAQNVLALSGEGLSTAEIAARTGLLPGEIELILNLKSAGRRKD